MDFRPLPLTVLATAAFEMDAAFVWYEQRQPGLDTDFIRACDAAFSAIARVPQAYREVRPRVRRTLLRRFPYMVFFVAEFESDPKLLTAIADALAALVPPGIQALAGLELGGVPIATALSIRTDLPVVFVRKQAKTYGTCRLAEGCEIAGLRLLIVEDVVTSGGQVLESCDELRRAGAIVEEVVCVIDREAGGAEALATRGLNLRSLLTKKDLDHARSEV